MGGVLKLQNKFFHSTLIAAQPTDRGDFYSILYFIFLTLIIVINVFVTL